MSDLHPASIGVAVVWTMAVLAALATSSMAASAGRMEGVWVGLAMGGGFAMLAAVYVAVTLLPERWPRIVRRLILIAGMGGAFWSMGSLTRAMYSLTL